MSSEATSLLPKYLRAEESLSPEFKNFVSSLPKQESWISSSMYKYKGFWIPIRALPGIISCSKHFDFKDSDIFLVTSPKSGTTWLKSLMFTLVNRNLYPVVDKNHPLFNNNPHDLFPFMEIKCNENPMSIPFDEFARLFSTHISYSSLPERVRNGCRIVYLCRNPKDVFISMWNFCNKLKFPGMETNSIGKLFEKFCNGDSPYGPYWDHVLEYWKGSKENLHKILFLRYEDMKNQPGIHLRRLAEFMDCPFSEDEEESGLVEKILELCSFENLSNLDVNRYGKLSSGEENNSFFRQGKVGDWKNYLSEEMAEKIDRISEEKFGQLGLMV